MRQTIIKNLEQIKPIIDGKVILLVKDHAYDYLEIKEFFDDIPHVEFSGFTPNPLYEQVCKGIELFNRHQCELIVAVGGGSTIDVAKCIKLYCRMDKSVNYLVQETFDSGVTMIAIPTTAGTGSESTCHAVIYFKDEKQSISHASILPNYAVLEPSVLKTLPIYQKKCTMLDALCQAIEAWWSINSTDESKEYSRKAIVTIRKNWEEYIFDNLDKASEKIMTAANYAGRAINITATTAVHAMSYKITALYKLPHGHAVAVCMPEVWKYMLDHMGDCVDKRGKEYLKIILDQIAEIMDLSYFEFMLEKMEMSYPIARDRDQELDVLTQAVNLERLRNNPITLSSNDLRDMYRRIVK